MFGLGGTAAEGQGRRPRRAEGGVPGRVRMAPSMRDHISTKEEVMKNQRIAIGAGALALAAAAVGPWVSVMGALSVGPTANTEVTIVVFGGIAVLVLAALMAKAMRPATIVVGLAAVAESVYALVKIQQIKSDAGEWGALIQPGWGLYLTIVVGVFLVISTWIVRERQLVAVGAVELPA